MKKTITALILIILLLMIGGCGKETDAQKFKEEYETVNGEKQKDNTIRTLDIPKENPFIYKEAKDIVKAIEDDETFVVYFGFSTCPWCRSVLPYLIESAKDNDIDEIYYVDVKEIRDIIEYDEDTKEFKTTKEGDKDYLKLTELLADVLNDYKLYDDTGDELLTGTKRIYAPNIIVVDHGKALKMESGISDLQTDSYMEITNEMEKDMINNFNELFKALKPEICSPETGC